MRVTRPAYKDEQGAVAIILALCLVVLVGAGALAVDTAQAWSARRQLTMGTDAAALATARALATKTGGCELAAPQLFKNAPAGRLASCTPSAGTVTVSATQSVPYALAAVLGQQEGTVHASTTVQYGTPSSVRGLRPITLCDQVGPLAAWLATGPNPVSATYKVPYTKESDEECGEDAPGNWGVEDFDGGANSTTDTRDWTRNGYEGSVKVGESLHGDPGALSTALSSELTHLRDEHTIVEIPTFDKVTGRGAGALFHVSNFVALKIVDFKVTGPQSGRYIKLTFLRQTAPGQSGGTQTNLGLSTLGICGTRAVSGKGALP